jgi:hypothetical protein
LVVSLLRIHEAGRLHLSTVPPILHLVKLVAATVISGLLAFWAYAEYVHANSDLCGADPEAFRCSDAVESASFWAFWIFLVVCAVLALVSLYRVGRWLRRERSFR